MAVNRERPHLLVLPEDDATRSLADGFSDMVTGAMQVLRPARGWPHVLETFLREQAAYMRRYPQAHIVLLIDYDDDYPDRLSRFQSQIPADIADRVYVLGALTEAETLRREVNRKFGSLGSELARECEHQTPVLWRSPQLQHNQPELARLMQQVRPFLCGP
jgi:hypothetical protein